MTRVERAILGVRVALGSQTWTLPTLVVFKSRSVSLTSFGQCQIRHTAGQYDFPYAGAPRDDDRMAVLTVSSTVLLHVSAAFVRDAVWEETWIQLVDLQGLVVLHADEGRPAPTRIPEGGRPRSG